MTAPTKRLFGRVLTAAIAASALFLSACGGGGDAEGVAKTDPENPTAITVGVIPIVDTAAFRLGVDKGIFAEHGLDVTVQDAQGGAAIVPAVMSGDNQIGFSNVSSPIIAYAQGTPIQLIGGAAGTTGSTENDFGGIVLPAGSDIKSPKDLAGKTVAVNTLNNIGDTLTRAAVERDGGDPSAVKFVEMAFPDMPAQLANGNIEAAWIVDPFFHIVQDQGATVLDHNLATFDENLQIAAFFTTKEYAEANPGVVDAFRTALYEANKYATDNPEETREFLTSYLKVDAKVQESIVLPAWPSDINTDVLQKLADAGHKYGMISEEVDVTELLG